MQYWAKNESNNHTVCMKPDLQEFEVKNVKQG